MAKGIAHGLASNSFKYVRGPYFFEVEQLLRARITPVVRLRCLFLTLAI